MSRAKCFNCGAVMDMARDMDDLVADRFPVFCSVSCSEEFPDNGTEEFDKRLKELAHGN